jgi:hypothetical protein
MDRNDFEVLKSITLLKSIISIVQPTIQAQLEGDRLSSTIHKARGVVWLVRVKAVLFG